MSNYILMSAVAGALILGAVGGVHLPRLAAWLRMDDYWKAKEIPPGWLTVAPSRTCVGGAGRELRNSPGRSR